MKNINQSGCYRCNTPLLKKRIIILLNTLVTSVTPATFVTTVTNVTKTRCLRDKCRQIIPFLKPLFQILCLVTLIALPNIAKTQESVTRVTKYHPKTTKKGAVLQKMTAADLPDFGQAADMYDCEFPLFKMSINGYLKSISKMSAIRHFLANVREAQ